MAIRYLWAGWMAAGLLFVGCTRERSAAAPRLHGAFIQYNAWMTSLDEPAWQRELDAMRRAGLRLIILQNLWRGDREVIPPSPGSPDPTRIILRYADAHGMQVFFGLTTDAAWWQPAQWTNVLESHAGLNMTVADEIWKRYGEHRAFAGWYLPQELWDGPFTAEQVALARRFFRRVGDHCRSLSPGRPKPVAISPFFAGQLPPGEVQQLYRDFLDGAGVDILMLQDGVGARGWDEDVEEKVAPYFEAFAQACRANRVEFWVNVESFMLAEGTPVAPRKFLPADPERFRRQLTVAAPYARRLVTFEFVHYLSPHLRGERARKLYDEYLKMRGGF